MNRHHRSLRGATALAATVYALLNGSLAGAQAVVDIRMERDTVSARSRPGFESQGRAFGGFKLQPSVTVATLATDNLYARRDVKVSDVSVSVQPALSLQSQWAKHALNLSASATVDRHPSHSIENIERFEMAGDGRIDAGTGTHITAEAGFARRIEPRGTTGDTLFGAKPIAYTLLTGGLGFEQEFGRTRLSLTGQYERYRYLDRRLGNVVIDQSARDFESVTGDVRLAQAVSPGIAVFADASLSHNRYPVKIDGLNRNSTGVTALGGVLFGISRLLQGEIGAGYLRQTFKDPVFPTISGFDYHVHVRWSPTRMTDVRLFAARSFQRSPIANIAGVEQQDIVLAVEHELRRNILLRPGASYTTAKFRGSERRDHFAEVHFGVAWFVNRHLEIDGTVAHGLGRNNVPTAWAREYDQNRATLGITWRL
ncbi:MAG: hypothetical protein RIS94_979 [Pseudomonadota bacterium]|jgi:hypothetical protein